MRLVPVLLLPLTFLYSIGTRLRNFIYDRGWRSSVSFETNVVVVGNLEAGGTGKTPMIEYLLELLSGSYRVAMLSRGYKRRTKGFILADEEQSPETLGDEPYQVFSKYGEKISVAVGEQRETAIPFILANRPETDVILMDDGYQYRTVIPGASILLTRYDRPFTRDLLLPSGRLREPRKAAGRADMIVVTKCPPGISKVDMDEMRSEISRYSQARVYFTTIEYGHPERLQGGGNPEKVIGVSGIAHPDGFEKFLQERFTVVKTFRFSDHYNYSLSEINGITDAAKKSGASIVLTEKDAVKWKSLITGDTPVFSIPVKVRFLEDGTLFDEQVTASIREYELPY